LSKQIDEIVQLGKTGQSKSQSRRNNASSGGRSASSSSTKGPKRSQGELGAQAKNAGPDSSTPIDPTTALGSKGAMDTIVIAKGGGEAAFLSNWRIRKERKSDDRKVAQVLELAKNVRMVDHDEEDLRKAALGALRLLGKLQWSKGGQ
jgi:hypothetical protein